MICVDCQKEIDVNFINDIQEEIGKIEIFRCQKCQADVRRRGKDCPSVCWFGGPPRIEWS